MELTDDDMEFLCSRELELDFTDESDFDDPLDSIWMHEDNGVASLKRLHIDFVYEDYRLLELLEPYRRYHIGVLELSCWSKSPSIGMFKRIAEIFRYERLAISSVQKRIDVDLKELILLVCGDLRMTSVKLLPSNPNSCLLKKLDIELNTIETLKDVVRTLFGLEELSVKLSSTKVLKNFSSSVSELTARSPYLKSFALNTTNVTCKGDLLELFEAVSVMPRLEHAAIRIGSWKHVLRSCRWPDLRVSQILQSVVVAVVAYDYSALMFEFVLDWLSRLPNLKTFAWKSNYTSPNHGTFVASVQGPFAALEKLKVECFRQGHTFDKILSLALSNNRLRKLHIDGMEDWSPDEITAPLVSLKRTSACAENNGSLYKTLAALTRPELLQKLHIKFPNLITFEELTPIAALLCRFVDLEKVNIICMNTHCLTAQPAAFCQHLRRLPYLTSIRLSLPGNTPDVQEGIDLLRVFPFLCNLEIQTYSDMSNENIQRAHDAVQRHGGLVRVRLPQTPPEVDQALKKALVRNAYNKQLTSRSLIHRLFEEDELAQQLRPRAILRR